MYFKIMSKDLDYIINDSEHYFQQKLHDFRIRKNGLVFSYSSNYFMLFNIVSYNIFKQYTLSDVYIDNVSDALFLNLITKYSENKYINLKDIKYILLKHCCKLDINESREKEWDFFSYTKWIVLKK